MTETRARALTAKGKANRVTHALRHAPANIQKAWIEDFAEDATTAMGRLLRGASHICPACGYDGRKVDKFGHHYTCGCEEPNVNALRLYCELARMVGAPNTFILNLGIRDEQELRDLVDAGRRLRSLENDATASLDAFRDEACALLQDVFKVHPEWRKEVLARLSGPSTNGHP